MTNKVDINIKQSINTDSINQDVYMFGDTSAPLITNTGIERDGGVTNIYEVEQTLPPNSSSYVTPEGDVLTKRWDGLVKLKGTSLGYVSPFTIQDMCSIKQVDDVILSSNNKTFITAKLIGNTIELFEYDISTTPSTGNPFGSNEITYDSAPTIGLFPGTSVYPSLSLYPSNVGSFISSTTITIDLGFSSTSDVYTSLSFVRTDSFQWSSNKEFLIRVGADVYKVSEAAPTSPILFTGLLAGFNQLNYLYGYAYDATNYLVNLVGNNQNKSFIITSWASKTKTDIRCRYAVPQRSNNYTRHLITCDPLTDGTRTKAVGYVGYTSFTASFSASEVWSTLSSSYTTATYTQPTSFNTGFGYSEYIIKTTASNNYTNVYAPQFVKPAAPSVVVDAATQSNNTSLLWNYYGKLNNFGGVTPSRPLEWRVNWVNGTQSFLSVAPRDSLSSTDGAKDILGITLTEVGAFDDSYQPQLMTDNTILYRANGNFYVVAVDYDAGAGYFNSEAWTEAIFSGTSTVTNTEGVISTASISATPSVTLTLPIALRGGQYPWVVLRYKTNDPTDIILQYANSQHSYSSSYQNSFTPIADGEWHVQKIKTTLADWQGYDITGIKLLMGSTIGSNWSLYQVYMSYKDTQYIPQVQKISDAAYKLNTVYPLNIVNIRTGLIEPGSVDYHGSMKYSYTGAQALVPYRTVANINSLFSNSIDTGEKISNCDFNVSSASAIIDPIGTRLVGNTSYAVDIYVAPTTAPASTPIYSFSVLESGTELIDPLKTDTPYQSNTVLPIPMGYRYNQFAAYSRNSTIFYNTTNPVSIGNIGQGTSIGYDGYTIGNDIPGTYVPFLLLGTRYIQDLNFIYQVQFQNDIYAGHFAIASSIGMNYVGTSPTMVYFLSNFDNSLYSFDGNRILQKFQRMSQIDTIINGAYSTKDNTLCLNTSSTYVWIRDGVVTQNSKKANQDGDMTFFETRDGLIVMNNFYFWAYTYNQLSFNQSYSLVPLEWRSAHFGVGKNQKSILSEWVFTILNVERSKNAAFKVTVYTKDESDNYLTQVRYITLWPKDFNEQGYASFRIKPAQYRPLACSIQLEQVGDNIPKIILLDVIAEMKPDTNAVIAAKKTK